MSTRDDVLTWRHLQALFDPHLPAGTYAEVVYFLPWAFRFLFDRLDGFGEITNAVAGWIAKNTESLVSDGLLESARVNLLACLEQWAGGFDVLRHSVVHRHHCTWRLYYVKNSETVTEFLAQLIRHGPQADVAAEFLRSISFRSCNKFQLAWFLELSRSLPSVLATDSFFRNLILPPEITTLLSDRESRRRAALVVMKEFVPLPEQAAYWDETFVELGIA